MLASFALSSFGKVSLSISDWPQRLNPPASASKYFEDHHAHKGSNSFKTQLQIKVSLEVRKDSKRGRTKRTKDWAKNIMFINWRIPLYYRPFPYMGGGVQGTTSSWGLCSGTLHILLSPHWDTCRPDISGYLKKHVFPCREPSVHLSVPTRKASVRILTGATELESISVNEETQR